MSSSGWLARVEVMYGGADDAEFAEILDRSLDPLGPDVLFDLAGELGIDADSLVVDVGARDGTQMLELRRRFGCAAVGIEPMSSNP